MKLAAMQPYFFPYIGYFQLIKDVDVFILYDRVSYSTGGWFNRNRLLRVNAEPFYIIVPVQNCSVQTLTRDVYLDNKHLWRKQMLKWIENNYRRATYFQEIFPLVEKALSGSEERLSDLNYATLHMVCDFLEISTPIVQEHSGFEQIEHELGSAFSDQDTTSTDTGVDKKTLRIFKICQLFNTKDYINAIGGQALYSQKVFAEHGIDLKFIQTRPYQYTQRASRFFPHLSIIDVLMNCGKEGTQQLLQQYDLV